MNRLMIFQISNLKSQIVSFRIPHSAFRISLGARTASSATSSFRIPHSAFRIFFICLTSFLTFACASPHYRGPGTPIQYPGIQEQLAGKIQARWPREFRLKQRLALHALDKQYDMLGYLIVGADGSLRAVAMGEMGGRIFDLALEGGQPKILKKPEQMPENPLLNGVLGDLRHLYLPPAGAAQREIGVSVERGLSLALKHTENHTTEYSFRIQNHELYRSRESIDGDVVREAEYGDYRRLGGSDPIPARIVLINHRWHYTLEIQTLEIIPQ